MSNDSQIPRFTLKRASTPVEIETKDGQIKTILVREMSGGERSIYLSEMTRMVRIDPELGKMSSLRNTRGIQGILLSKCLVNAADNSHIPPTEYEEYPGNLYQFLFDTARHINGLTKESSDAKKS